MCIRDRRYLKDELVEARPPSLGYRLRKFARKKRVALLVAGAFLTVLLAALAGISYFANRARLTHEQLRMTEYHRQAELRLSLIHI